MINAPSLELEKILNSRKEKFLQFRLSNGLITYDRKEKESTQNKEDAVKSTQTYTEKIKGGYFGKRKARF